MDDVTAADRGRKRLAFLLEHFIEHAQSHALEMAEQRDAISPDAGLDALFATALNNVEALRSSLRAILQEIRKDSTSGHAYSYKPEKRDRG